MSGGVRRRIGRRIGAVVRNALAVLVVGALVACTPLGADLGDGSAAPRPAATPVRMLVVTNRSPSADPATAYSGERADGVGWAEVVVAPTADDVAAGRPYAHRPLAPAEARDWFRAHAARRVLVHVHGFRTDFGKAVHRFARVVRGSRTDFEPVLFSWPSRGSIWDYYYDRESIDGSRDDLERLLRRIADDPAVGEVAVLAHSMGSWLAMETVRTMAVSAAGVPRKLRNIVLAAPDLDVGVFDRQMERIGRHPSVTLVVSRDDRSLQVSKVFGGGFDRLGATGPNDPRWRRSFCARGVSVVDVSDLPTTGVTNHYKFSDEPALLAVLGARLFPDASPGSAAADTGAVVHRPLNCGGGPDRDVPSPAPIVVHDPAPPAAHAAAKP